MSVVVHYLLFLGIEVVRRTLYSVHRTLYNIRRTLYNVRGTMYVVQYGHI